MSSTRRKEVIKLLKSYGFGNFRLLPNDHMACDHPRLERPFQFANSPSGGGYVRDVELRIRRLLGISGRGRVAVEGKRRVKHQRQVPQQRVDEQQMAKLRTLAEVRAAHARLKGLDQLMRERPY